MFSLCINPKHSSSDASLRPTPRMRLFRHAFKWPHSSGKRSRHCFSSPFRRPRSKPLSSHSRTMPHSKPINSSPPLSLCHCITSAPPAKPCCKSADLYRSPSLSQGSSCSGTSSTCPRGDRHLKTSRVTTRTVNPFQTPICPHQFACFAHSDSRTLLNSSAHIPALFSICAEFPSQPLSIPITKASEHQIPSRHASSSRISMNPTASTNVPTNAAADAPQRSLSFNSNAVNVAQKAPFPQLTPPDKPTAEHRKLAPICAPATCVPPIYTPPTALSAFAETGTEEEDLSDMDLSAIEEADFAVWQTSTDLPLMRMDTATWKWVGNEHDFTHFDAIVREVHDVPIDNQRIDSVYDVSAQLLNEWTEDCETHNKLFSNALKEGSIDIRDMAALFAQKRTQT